MCLWPIEDIHSHFHSNDRAGSALSISFQYRHEKLPEWGRKIADQHTLEYRIHSYLWLALEAAIDHDIVVLGLGV